MVWHDRAGVAAWRRFHPNQTASDGKQAVAIILAVRFRLRVDDA
jgi:hypothetical protein